MNKRDTFLNAATAMFPKQTEFSRAELVEVANSVSMKYAPSWIVKSDEFKPSNGLYSLFANSNLVSSTATRSC